MSNLASLSKLLYQESFTSKGSLLFEVISSVKGEGESWELFEKKGKLFLRGESEKALVYALSFLKNLSPETALTFVRRVQPRFPTRALMLEETLTLDQETVKRILTLGFNTIVGDYAPVEGLSILPFTRLPSNLMIPRDKTLLDVQVEELKKAEDKKVPFIFFSDEITAFEELNYQATCAFLSFKEKEVWDYLAQTSPFGTPLLPVIKCSSKLQLPLLLQNELSFCLSQMQRHPYAGLIIQATRLPEKGSFEEANLFVAGFSQMVDLDPRLLTKYWFKTNLPHLWNEEAIQQFDSLARFKPREGIKEDRQKILADIAFIETRWPNTPYALKAPTFKPH